MRLRRVLRLRGFIPSGIQHPVHPTFFAVVLLLPKTVGAVLDYVCAATRTTFVSDDFPNHAMPRFMRHPPHLTHIRSLSAKETDPTPTNSAPVLAKPPDKCAQGTFSSSSCAAFDHPIQQASLPPSLPIACSLNPLADYPPFARSCPGCRRASPPERRSQSDVPGPSG